MLQLKKDMKSNESSEAPTPDSTTVESKSYICGEEVLVHLSDERFYLGFIAKIRYKEAECLVKFGDNTVKWVFLKNVTRMTCTSTNTQLCYSCNIDTLLDDEVCVCDKCANIYHRNCHKPEVTVLDISVWMCAPCKAKQQILNLQNKMCGVSSKIIQKNISQIVPKSVTPIVQKSVTQIFQKNVTPIVPKSVTPIVPRSDTPIILPRSDTPIVQKSVTPNVSKSVTPIVPKSVSPIVPKSVIPIVPKIVPPIVPKIVPPIVSTNVTPIVPRGVTPIVPKGVTPIVPKCVTPIVPKGVTSIVPKSVTQIVPKNENVPQIVKLPYDLNSLQWDIHHRINNLGTYCYCGGPGDWFIKMLQCAKCLQWFHGKCVSSLVYPLYLGDRFYVFVCSVCNKGSEFMRRIEMEWSDLVHLVLFNMTALKPQKYYDVDISILPYLDKHWNSMYLPSSILNVPVDDRKVFVVNSLLKDTNHRFEFQGKKPTNMWGLRLKLPPKPPRFSLPFQVPIDENLVHHQLCSKFNLKLLPILKKTDTVINQQFIEPKYSVEGLKFLHQDSPVVMLPKGLPSIGHNVCIKSASPIVPAPRSVIERRIRQQQVETNKRTSRSSSVVTSKVKKSLKKEKVPESRSPSRSTESTPEKYISATEGELLTSDEDADDDEDLDDEDDACSTRTTGVQSRRSQRLSVNRLLNRRPEVRISPPCEARSAASITLPLSLAPVISQPQVRTTKRRLSEKDLQVDSNGQYLVKRKRLRRNNSRTPNKRQSKTNCNGRPMYKSYSDFFAIHGHSVNRPCSPDTVVNSCSDLKTLVHSYFGASNRIANGEDYTILCKRTNPDGSEEFLIRWD